jgi:hypothetical protein
MRTFANSECEKCEAGEISAENGIVVAVGTVVVRGVVVVIVVLRHGINREPTRGEGFGYPAR